MRTLEYLFKSVDKGGFSTCIHDGDLTNPWFSGSVLSNCVGLVWTLFALDHDPEIAELLQRLKMRKRISGNARDIYAQAKKNGSGYLCSYAPKSGSIACYGAGTKAGHVVYLLWVWANGQAVGIESNYSGNLSNKRLLRVKYGNPKEWYKEYQGCIYDYSNTGGGR